MTVPFVIMTGASGVGKTTIARNIKERRPEIDVYLEDELGRPTEEFMAGIGPTDGPGGPFQRGFALYFVSKLAKLRKQGRPILLDCQCRIAFLKEAISAAKLTNGQIVLVECDDVTRDARLHGRGSPELAHEQMRSWSRYLHKEAEESEVPIINTGLHSLADNVALLLALM